MLLVKDFEAVTAYLEFPELQWMHLRTTNPLLVVVDTWRADHSSRDGYSRPTTPNFDAFAEDVLVSDQAISQCGVGGIGCLVS